MKNQVKLLTLLTTLTFSVNVFATAPTEAQINSLKLNCTVGKVQRDNDGEISTNDKLSLSASINKKYALTLVGYSINGYDPRLDAIIVDSARENEKSLQLSGKRGSFLERRVVGKVTYNKIKKSGSYSIEVKDGKLESGVEGKAKFDFHSCVAK